MQEKSPDKAHQQGNLNVRVQSLLGLWWWSTAKNCGSSRGYLNQNFHVETNAIRELTKRARFLSELLENCDTCV